MRQLGLIGGLGPGATVHYYQDLVKRGAGEMLIINADVNRVMQGVAEGDRQGLANYFARLIERLKAGGAEVAAITAVAPHVCVQELQRLSVLPLTNLIDEVSEEIRSRGLKRVALLGTRYVMETRMYGMLKGVEIVIPEEIDTIHAIYYQFVKGDVAGRSVLEKIAQKQRADAVVMGGTDFALAFDETNTHFAHVDCLRAHTKGIMRALRNSSNLYSVCPNE